MRHKALLGADGGLSLALARALPSLALSWSKGWRCAWALWPLLVQPSHQNHDYDGTVRHSKPGASAARCNRIFRYVFRKG